jgi:hypothetical protein
VTDRARCDLHRLPLSNLFVDFVILNAVAPAIAELE